MSNLAAKYDYLEKLTRKVIHPQNKEPKKKVYVPFRGGGDRAGGTSKKKQKPAKEKNISANDKKPRTFQKAAQQQTSAVDQNAPQVKVHNGNQQNTEVTESVENFNAVDILRQRLHQKIEESRGQGPPKDPSSEEVQKRRTKRKLERERKKRKRKEFRMKKLAESASTEAEGENTAPQMPVLQDSPAATSLPKKDVNTIIFNRVELGEAYVEKGSVLKEKKKRKVKGLLTPLTGKNYKQLLSRVEARKARLEELRTTDEKKAKKEEEKMKWTNVLYKAQGMKIKDNEELLRASLKKKEKRKAQVKKKWATRCQNVVEKMQNRQDKRRRNLKRRKDVKMEKRKQRARKRGRVLPEDLKKAAV
ncbi:surfeit locus protein 6 [Brachyhypopomus gauderio]|uniref:surfeit locus protein 6 n=1 Tax=Brachyhypopomus gauderio TaxID=698409 RepID=UPI004042FF35